MSDVDEDVANDLNLPVDHGALIQQAAENGPADDAGLRGSSGNATSGNVTGGGDLLVKVDGQEVENSGDVAAAIEDNQPGETIEVEYYRGDDLKTASIELAERPEELSSSSEPQQPNDQGGGLLPLP
jgi:S1-C subfamily serine protease